MMAVHAMLCYAKHTLLGFLYLGVVLPVSSGCSALLLICVLRTRCNKTYWLYHSQFTPTALRASVPCIWQCLGTSGLLSWWCCLSSFPACSTVSITMVAVKTRCKRMSLTNEVSNTVKMMLNTPKGHCRCKRLSSFQTWTCRMLASCAQIGFEPLLRRRRMICKLTCFASQNWLLTCARRQNNQDIKLRAWSVKLMIPTLSC